MKTGLLIFGFSLLTVAPSAFADGTQAINGSQAMSKIMNMIPLEIRTNAFNGTTPSGQSCRVEIVLTNYEPIGLVLGVSLDSGKPANIFVNQTDAVQMTNMTVGEGAVSVLENKATPGWKISVTVPHLSRPQERMVTSETKDAKIACAINTNRNDN